MTETWKKLSGFDWEYEVSDAGKVRNVATGNVLRGAINNDGYRRVAIRQNGKFRLMSVHRLVAIAFIGPIYPGLEVNHKNGIKSDAALDNLEIITRSENHLHAYRELGHKKMQGSLHGCSKLTETQVLQIRTIGASGERGIGKRLAKQFGVGPQIVSFILSRKNWRHI